MKRFNRAAWNATRLDIEAQIRALKHDIRKVEKKGRHYDSGLNQVTDFFYKGPDSGQLEGLALLKLQATTLYRMRAAARGRQHVRSYWDKDVKGAWVKLEGDPGLEPLGLIDCWGFWMPEVQEVGAEPQP